MVKQRNGGTVQGSFGIPEEMRDQINRHRESKSIPRKEEDNRADADSEPTDFSSEEPHTDVPKDSEQEQEVTDPVEILRKMGAEFTQDDFNHLLFKGFYEKDIPVVGEKLKGRFRTLRGAEYEELDETLAEETKMVDMTGQGFEIRRSLLIISYGVTHLNGKPVAKPQFKSDGKTVDTKKMAAARREVFNNMHPGTVNMIIRKHGAMTMALNMIVENPGEYVKNS